MHRGAVATARALARPRREAGVIRVSGNIEVTDADVRFKLSGRVDEHLVQSRDGVEGL